MNKENNLATFAFVLVVLLLSACKKDPPEIPCGDTLFGQPVATTGLDAERCKAVCECKGFTSRDFTADEIATLRSWTLSNPYANLTANPYDDSLTVSDPAVCAVVVEDLANRLYRLQSFPDTDAVEDAGAILTHHDACGLCSTLSDFAVYAEDRDIGAAVRDCALATLAQPFDSLVTCIQNLGFTPPCAKIWAYNTLNTRQHCFQLCFNAGDYNNEDGTLGPCLQCDEDMSGPVFKEVAGRTRRNTGLASSICRFCEEVKPVPHDYPF